MAGTVHGVVNKTWPRFADNSYYNAPHVVACFAQFFDHLSTPAGGSIMSKVACHYGGGTGWDYPGGSTPVGYNAPMGVWKMNTSTLRPGGGSALGEIYIFIACFGPDANHEARDFGGGLTVNSDIYANCRMGLQVAFREDGGDPWAESGGGELLTGTDRPGDPPFAAGASTIHFLMPYACNPGGSYTNGKRMHNMGGNNGDWYDAAILEGYFHGVADDDNIVCIYTQADQMDSEPKDYQALVIGIGELKPLCGSDPYFSYCWHDGGLPFNRGSAYGDTTNDSATNSGGVKAPRSTIQPLRATTYITGLDQVRAPNIYSPTGLVYEEGALYVYSDDAMYGYAHEPGGDDFWRVVYGVPNEAYDATNKRAAFGTQTTLQEKLTIPWPDSIGEVPGATRTPEGVAF